MTDNDIDRNHCERKRDIRLTNADAVFLAANPGYKSPYTDRPELGDVVGWLTDEVQRLSGVLEERTLQHKTQLNNAVRLDAIITKVRAALKENP